MIKNLLKIMSLLYLFRLVVIVAAHLFKSVQRGVLRHFYLMLSHSLYAQPPLMLVSP